jgi:hypothetical protein
MACWSPILGHLLPIPRVRTASGACLGRAGTCFWFLHAERRGPRSTKRGNHLNTVQLCNSAPITISLCFVHSEGRLKEKALTLSSHSACHSTARWKNLLRLRRAGPFTAPPRSLHFLAAAPPLSHRRIPITH